MLTTADLAQARADILDTLPGTAVIQRATVATDDYGHTSETWAAVGTAVCRLDPFQRQDTAGMVAEREANRAYFRLTLPWDATISDGDRVVIAGETMDVLQLHDTHSNRLVKRAVVARVAS